jgi:hypothetical protein
MIQIETQTDLFLQDMLRIANMTGAYEQGRHILRIPPIGSSSKPNETVDGLLFHGYDVLRELLP